MQKKAWRPVKVPLDTHKKLKILAKRQGRAIWNVIDDAIAPKTIGEAWRIGGSSEFDRHLWYLFKFTMSYGYLKACLVHADDYRDAYKLFERRCRELSERLGIDCEGVPKRVLNLLTGKSRRPYRERIMKANEIIKEIMKMVILNAFK